jgi:hypothetical protein
MSNFTLQMNQIMNFSIYILNKSISLVLCILPSIFWSQEIVYGPSGYVEYHKGQLPIIISVAHGGNLNPSTIPDRTCNSPVYATDINTIETGLAIKEALHALTGCYPHLIISNLDRKKLDCNRNMSDGACGNPEAEAAWTAFHNFISLAQDSANNQFANKTFFVDLHGHGNPIDRIELGYLLYDDELELSDATLNSPQYVGYSSIQNLVLQNVNGYAHTELLKGNYSLGTYLSNLGYPTVPSNTIPFPGINNNYYSGGYITANHTCYANNEVTNGLQMELNYSNIRDTPLNRETFAIDFSQSIIAFIQQHYSLNINGCNSAEIDENINYGLTVFPNPILKGEMLKIIYSGNDLESYEILSFAGKSIIKEEISMPSFSISTENLEKGAYLMAFRCHNNRLLYKYISII